MTAIHQFVPTMSARDAIGRHTLGIREVLLDLGVESHIYADEVRGDPGRDIRRLAHFERPNRRTWLLYQASTGSVVAEFLRGRAEPKLLDYHNVTPRHFFTGWDPEQAVRVSDGRHEIAALARSVDLAFTDSVFDEADLRDWGCSWSVVAPVLTDPRDLAGDPDPRAVEMLSQARSHGGSDWLYVGRFAPNKAQHDLVKALAVYRHAFDPAARLHLVGADATPSYVKALAGFVDATGLSDAVRFHRSVTAAELTALYRGADVFVSASEHEGFGVPLVEAMRFGLPIVAYAAGAVPETVGEAGVLLATKRAGVFATAVDRVLGDAAVRGRLSAAARARAADYEPARVRRCYEAAFRCLLEGHG